MNAVCQKLSRREIKLQSEINDLDTVAKSARLKMMPLRRQLSQLQERRRETDQGPQHFENKRKGRITPDPVLVLFKANQLTQEQFQAAEEIRDVWEALGAGGGLQAANMEPSIRADGPYQGAIEKLPFNLENVYRKKWLPWARMNSQTRAQISGVTVKPFDIAIAIAGDRKSLSEVVSGIRVRKSDGLEQVKIIFLKALNAW